MFVGILPNTPSNALGGADGRQRRPPTAAKLAEGQLRAEQDEPRNTHTQAEPQVSDAARHPSRPSDIRLPETLTGQTAHIARISSAPQAVAAGVLSARCLHDAGSIARLRASPRASATRSALAS